MKVIYEEYTEEDPFNFRYKTIYVRENSTFTIETRNGENPRIFTEDQIRDAFLAWETDCRLNPQRFNNEPLEINTHAYRAANCLIDYMEK